MPAISPCSFNEFLWQPLTVLTRQTRQTVCVINQSIFLRCLWLMLTVTVELCGVSCCYFSYHRYLRKVDSSSFVLCQQLALPPPRAFLWQPLTVLTRQTRQTVCAINQSIFLRCLWLMLTVAVELCWVSCCHVSYHKYLRKVDCSSFIFGLATSDYFGRGHQQY